MKTAHEILKQAGLPPPRKGEDRYYTLCPHCSAQRSPAHRKIKCVGITITAEGVQWGCNHCDFKGGQYFNGKDNDPVIATYDYTDESGRTLFRKVRTQAKKFWQQHPDGRGGWTSGIKNIRRVLYKYPELIEAIALERTILIVEGEKDADNLHRLGIPATCNPEGASEAGKTLKWRTEYSEALRGANVVLLPDNDEAGWKHIHNVGAALTGIAARMRVLILPNLPPKGDVSDWIDAGGTREQLDALIEQAADWKPPNINDGKQDKARAEANAKEDQLLAALAALPPGIEFARRRAEAAKELGVPRGSIDDELQARRAGDEKPKPAPLFGHWIVEPWPDVVDGDSLLADIIKRIRKSVICTHDDALASALWIMFAWVHNEVATHSPILLATSAEPECGKTTLLGLTAHLMPRCISSVEITEAALYRSIDLWRPSFVVDEFDKVLKSDDNNGLRAVINSGHTRSVVVVRCIPPDYTPKAFEVFCPKAIGMIGRQLPAATLGRCIIIEMRRRKANESIAEPFDHNDSPELAQLRSRLRRWSIDSEDVLRGVRPSMPPAFDNRRGDNWRVLISIADLAGGDWGEKARQAAARIEGAADVTTIGVRLLIDIKRIFDDPSMANADCILSATLVAKLKEDEEAPWAEWSHGKGLTQNSLAILLGGGGGRGRASRGGFSIRSDTVHPSKDVQGKGYKRAWFEDAWASYLPAEISLNSPPGGE